LIARLSDSVAPLREDDLLGCGADQIRHLLCGLLDGFLPLPTRTMVAAGGVAECSVEVGIIASTTRGSTGVVA